MSPFGRRRLQRFSQPFPLSSLVPTGLGLAVLVIAWRLEARSWIPFAIGGLIVAVGLVSWAIMIAAYFRQQDWAQGIAAAPERPWRAESRWAEGFFVRAIDVRKTAYWWAGTAAAGAVAGIFLAVKPCQLSWAAVGGAAALGGYTAYRTWRLAKYGEPLLELEQMPVVPGRRLRAVVLCRSRVQASGRFRLTLRCIRSVVETVEHRGRHATRGQSLRKTVLCERTASAEGGPGNRSWQTAVPVDLEVPGNLPPTMTPLNRAMESSVVWTLTVAAETPGVDFETEFELPVFGVADERLIEKRPEGTAG